MADKNILDEGILLYNKGNYTAALTFFLSLPEDSGVDSLELSYYLGLCYAKLFRYDDAMIYLEQVVTGSKEDERSSQRVLQCRYLLAVIYCISGRKKLADFELKQLLELGYRKSAVYSSMAYVAWEQGNSALSVEYYEKSLEENSENAGALNGLAYVLACEDLELTKALSMCKKSIDITGERAANLDTLGWIYYKMKLYKESQSYLDRASFLEPENAVIQQHKKALSSVQE